MANVFSVGRMQAFGDARAAGPVRGVAGAIRIGSPTRSGKTFIVLALALATALSCRTAVAADYETAVVGVEPIGSTAIVGGTVIPYKEVTLAAQVPGEVRFIAGNVGDTFEKDTELVSIDDEAIQAKRRAALADIMNAEAALRGAQVQYSRELISPRTNSLTTMPGMGMPSLFDQFFTRNFSNMTGRSDSGFERHADLMNQATGVNQAESRLMASRAQLEALDAALRDTRLRAPFKGIIVEKLVEVGDTVQPGRPLIKFAFVNFLRLRAEVPIRLVAGLEKGMMVPARLDVRGAEVMARVAQIYPQADQSRHTVTVKFDLPEGIAGGAGMYAEVMIPDHTAGRGEMPVVPVNALVWRGSFPSVFVLTDENKVSLRLVRVGAPAGRDRVGILAGLSGGERIILNPPAGLVSGKANGR